MEEELEKTKPITDLNIDGLKLKDLETLRKEILSEYGNEMTSTNTVSSSNSAGRSYTNSTQAQRVNHSSYPGMSNSGFATNIIFGLIIAFASGAIVSTIYIFMNLGNSVFTL